ncbi:MAG: GIY-YIG nuclease family protein [Chitinophagaceae bacterium]|jgi:putative endonuclease|nr:GIY-YIG nuclease family protein [Chitinophagaceae bacterium]OQY92165.1 MAG: hypothetical protein B6D37_15280 [Sphingobacteriales bacterium UTBCD1]
MLFYVYIIYSEGYDRYYIGQTQDFETRLQRHNNGMEKATKPYKPWKLKCLIIKSTRGEAMILEKKIKNLNREKLERFIATYS